MQDSATDSVMYVTKVGNGTKSAEAKLSHKAVPARKSNRMNVSDSLEISKRISIRQSDICTIRTIQISRKMHHYNKLSVSVCNYFVYRETINIYHSFNEYLTHFVL